MTLRAPFNFIPLSEQVFYPEWANQISHDVPFSDGKSGILTIKITAKSPIFVRNGYTKEDAEKQNDIYTSFSNIDNRYFLPGTSLKGVIRNTMEILSFGKLSQVSSKRYGIRDLYLKSYISNFQSGNVHCGWLYKSGNTIKVRDCGIPYRVSHKEIDNCFNTEFCSIFTANNFGARSDHSSLYKYSLLNGGKQNKLISDTIFANLRVWFNEAKTKGKVDSRKMAVLNKNGKGKSGVLVVTGQSTGRRNKTGKFYEFIFPSVLNANELEINNQLYEDFCFIYHDSPEWAFWEKNMEIGKEVPVFFYLENDKIRHLGLSYLYKLPYPKTVDQYVYKTHSVKEKRDLSECIFGCVESESKALKGRVQISNAFLVSNGNAYSELLKPYMGSPKPTYYPIYLEQKDRKGANGQMGGPFITMLDRNAIVRGWKKYPIQNGWRKKFEIPNKEQEKNLNPFRPLKEGAIFTCKIRFFNLKPEELGALLYTLELSEGCFHNIGFAKAYGYGQIKVAVTGISGDVKMNEKEELKKKFQLMMVKQISGYEKSPQLKEFLAMSREVDISIPLEYMTLKEFATAKQQNFKKGIRGEYLRPYTEYIGKKKF